MLLTLTSKEHLADDAWRFRFEPERPLSWLAGQFIRLNLPHAEPDAGGTSRQFTIAGAPHEGIITVSTRLSGSTFKRALARLEPGATARLTEAPAGNFIWQASPRPHVFAAQGIGITPFYAIIQDRILTGQPVWATLLYAHQPGSAILFDDELKAWAAADPTLQIKTISGTLTAAQVTELTPDYAQRFVYVSGPKSFVSLCMPPHNLPINHLKQDNFPGYAATKY